MRNLWTLSVLLLATACANGNSTSSDTSNSPTVSSGGTANANIRECTATFSSVTQGKLASFFGHPVSNIEGAVTYCLSVSGNGSNVSGSTMRIEYEDDYGVRTYSTDASNVYGGKISIDTNGNTSIEVIFADEAGFVQVKGTAPNSGTFTGTVKFYNFPSFEDALSQQIADAQQKCKDGTYTVAQCLGYNFPPTYWWNQTYVTPSQALMAQADAIFNDNSKSTQLGTISAQLSTIWSK